MKYNFFVPGIPVAKGSAKAFYNKKAGKIVVMQDNRSRQKPWASMISYTAQESGVQIVDGPVVLSLTFNMPRPKSHYGSGKNSAVLKLGSPTYHTSVPDLDKLVRCVMDALTGIAWHDDKQVASIRTAKRYYGDGPGVQIEIEGRK